MNQLEFTTALIRLSQHRVGITEAATLFALAEGATVAQLMKIFRLDRTAIKGRVGILRAKKLAVTSFNGDGTAVYRLTERGQKIIEETLKK
jgi:DNA-binding MarR family transcriptional regulator